ncbi:MAG: xylose isomerase [Amycolatopsis sp.]|uniref:sugar phosphate isomerase/epimerase family protein n=1 Tax=Amycolatopsis sp. TaxID=37632 RepID=UPI0026059DF7|nr:sugar phosphate isomerase/epimerase [Amycolatopsis sp.]MCU1679419.1 xylose isomerase [Amycolatopsis sp.]
MTPAIAAQLWTFHDQAARDLEGVLTRISEIGYVAVEPLGLHGRTPKAVRSLLDELGMGVCSAHAPFPAGPDARKILDEQSELGADTVVWSMEKEEFDSVDAIRRGCERVNEGAENAREYGITVGYHNHYAEFANSFDGRSAYDVLLDHLHPDVVLELDMYWVLLGGGDPAAVVRELGERVKFLHVKDGPAKDNDDFMVPVGQGRVDVPAVLAAGTGVRWHIVELDRSRIDMIEALRQSYSYLVGEGLSRGRLAVAGKEGLQ